LFFFSFILVGYLDTFRFAKNSITGLLSKSLYLNHPVIEFRASSEGRAWSIEMTARHSATELLPMKSFLKPPGHRVRRQASIEMTGLPRAST
jgi:hypothetical protein